MAAVFRPSEPTWSAVTTWQTGGIDCAASGWSERVETKRIATRQFMMPCTVQIQTSSLKALSSVPRWRASPLDFRGVSGNGRPL